MTVNFYGDQYKWFEGIVEDRNDPLKLGRVRVRCFGLHTAETNQILTQHLPWASVMMPVSSASLNGIGQTPTGIVPGTRVVGFFRDGESAQDPLIIGTLPGISTTPAFQTRSNAITTPGERQAVYNGGVDPSTGEYVEPLKQLDLNKDLGINLLIIHCAATKPSMDIGVREIDQWHKARGWTGIGYHLVIRRNGVVEQGRPVGTQGSHALGYNKNSVGVCMVGGVDEQNRPQSNFEHAQWEQLKNIVAKFMTDYPGIKIIGHNEVAAKACPSFNVQQWLKVTFPGGQIADGDLDNLGDLSTDVEGKKVQEPNDDEKQDAGETEAFADDIATGSAVVNPNYTENPYGFIDPSGSYPRQGNLNEPDTNRLGRNDSADIGKTIVAKKDATRALDVPTGDNQTWSEPETPYNAQYPYNHVMETESGHIQEFDDTPGKERIHTYHKSGTFREVHPNGTTVTKVVKDNYEIIAGDDYVLISGTCNITIAGNANLDIAGDVNGKVAGKVDLQVTGNIDMRSEGDINIEAAGKMVLTAPGGLYEN